MKIYLSKILMLVGIGILSLNSSFAAPSVTLFQHVGFDGRSESFSMDDSDLRDNFIGNDEASSIQVPSGCEVTMYQHVGFEGLSETIGTGDFDLRDNSLGHDIASSIKVTCNAITPSVTLFQHVAFEGTSEDFAADDPDLRDNAIGNDAVSSLHVPSGCQATLYQHVGYEGLSEVFDSGDIDLRDNLQGLGNDVASSMRVTCAPITPSISLFQDIGFAGITEAFASDDPDLSDNAIGINSASSIKVPLGCTAILYANVNFTGSSETFNAGDDIDLSDNPLGDNIASSIKVSCKAPPPPQTLVVTLYQDDNQMGISSDFSADEPRLRSTAVGNNKVSSIRVPVGCTATIYQDPDYAVIDDDHAFQTFTAGDYSLVGVVSDDAAGILGDNEASAIMVDCTTPT